MEILWSKKEHLIDKRIIQTNRKSLVAIVFRETWQGPGSRQGKEQASFRQDYR
jgi:hypothetical protein